MRLGHFLKAIGATIALLCSVSVWAADFGDCVSMLRWTGAPEYRGGEPDHDILCRKGYVLSHNAERKVPDWVLEVLTPERFKGEADRKLAGFKSDPTIGRRGAAPVDYEKSGYQRGHMAPAEDMKWDQDAMAESFYMTNMAPQIGAGFNNGIWKSLETRIRRWAGDRERLIVITGPIYGDNTRVIGGNRDIAVPEAFYKIAYDPERKRAIAFLLPNEREKSAKLPEHIVTVREIEDATGLDFLARLPKRDQNRIESVRQPMWR